MSTGRGLDHHLQQPLEEVVQPPRLERGRRDPVQGQERPVTGRGVAVDGGGDGPVHGPVQEADLGTRGPGSALAVPDLQDAVAKDGQLDHDLAQVEAFAQTLEGVPLRGLGVEPGPAVDEVRLPGLRDGVEQGGYVVDEGLQRQPLRRGAVGDRGPPALEDGVPVPAQELGQLGR